MCGLFGYSGSEQKEVSDLFFDSLAHRGPDAQKSASVPGWTLGHLRLSIIDTSRAADQPMERGGNTLIFNGEIYNFVELREEYLKDAELTTTSDSEVLLELLNRHGTSILNKLNGMFAFAWYQADTGTLTLCRDRFGVKPLHYMHHEGTVYFSSEMRPLIRIRKPEHFNNAILRSFIYDTATDFDEQTFIPDIFQVEAGHYLTIDRDQTIEDHAWYHGSDFTYDRAILSDYATSLSLYEDLLTDSLKLRHRSDVPVCITLSGGLDSSTLYVLAKERLDSKVQPFTFAHPDSPTDESSKVRQLTESYGDTALFVESKHEDGVDALKESLYYSEFPLWNPSAVAYRNMYTSIRENGSTVVIEGHGSDEQLGGYPHMIDAAWKEMFIRGKFRTAATLYRVYQETLNPALLQGGRVQASPARQAFSMTVDFARTLLMKLKHPSKHPLKLQTVLDRDFNYAILPIVLRCFDRLSMSASLESRSPFMDYRLVEFARALPTEFKVNSIGSKAFLREILKKYGKDYIYMDKRKIGFASDVPRLLSDPQVFKLLQEKVQAFNAPAFASIKGQAEEDLRAGTITWSNSTNIWKVASLGITADMYGIKDI